MKELYFCVHEKIDENSKWPNESYYDTKHMAAFHFAWGWDKERDVYLYQLKIDTEKTLVAIIIKRFSPTDFLLDVFNFNGNELLRESGTGEWGEVKTSRKWAEELVLRKERDEDNTVQDFEYFDKVCSQCKKSECKCTQE